MKRAVVAGLCACSLLAGLAPVAWAKRIGVHDAADAPRYGTKAIGMVGRGVLNITTCFVDVLTQTIDHSKQGPPLAGTLKGLVYGTGCGVLRLGSGAVDVVTFWVPGFNGFPVSDSYDNCLLNTPASSARQERAPSVPSAMASPVEPPPSAPVISSAPASAASPRRTWKK